jgi:hypothetical protein
MKKLLFVALALIGANFAGAQDTPRLFLAGTPVDSLTAPQIEVYGAFDSIRSKWVIATDAGQVNSYADLVRTGKNATGRSEFTTETGEKYEFYSITQTINYLSEALGYRVASHAVWFEGGARRVSVIMEKTPGQ